MKIILLLILNTYVLASLDFAEQTKIIAPDTQQFPINQFGRVITGQNDWMFVSAISQKGAVYVYKYDGINWLAVDKLVTDNSFIDSDLYGNAISVSGNFLFVGAPQDQEFGTFNGVVYVYQLINGHWQLTTKLQPNDSENQDKFGFSISAFGNRVLIGAKNGETNGNNGAAYIYDYDGNNWIQSTKLENNIDFSKFGESVSMYHDIAVIGDYNSGGNLSFKGAAFIYKFINNSWSLTDTLTASDAQNGDHFGTAVQIHNNRIAISAPDEDSSGIRSGAIYIFEFHQDNNQWLESSKITASEITENEQFGLDFNLYNDSLIVGVEAHDNNGGLLFDGAAFVYNFNGLEWIETDIFFPSDNMDNQFFGSSIFQNELYCAIGARADTNNNGIGAGAVYIYQSDLIFNNGFE